MKLHKHSCNPIISPREDSDWESLITTNPAAWLDPDTGKVRMLYRASGHDPKLYVYFGLAESSDGLTFERLSDEPVFGPSTEGLDAGCVEDPRVTPLTDGWYAVTYACRAFPPGRYWEPGATHFIPPDLPDCFPVKYRNNMTTTCLALTRDFRDWYRAGPITSPTLDDRDVCLFPEQIDGRFFLIHRPIQWAGAEYGTAHPAMWIASSTDLLEWDYSQSRLLATSQFDWEVKIGGNTPPIRTEHGWLMLYHAKGPDSMYRVGAMLLDLEDPSVVRYRTRLPILEPETEWETHGCYSGDGVVFPCGKVVKDETLFVYYGAADKYVGVASCPLTEMIDYLLTCPADLSGNP